MVVYWHIEWSCLCAQDKPASPNINAAVNEWKENVNNLSKYDPELAGSVDHMTTSVCYALVIQKPSVALAGFSKLEDCCQERFDSCKR